MSGGKLVLELATVDDDVLETLTELLITIGDPGFTEMSPEEFIEKATALRGKVSVTARVVKAKLPASAHNIKIIDLGLPNSVTFPVGRSLGFSPHTTDRTETQRFLEAPVAVILVNTREHFLNVRNVGERRVRQLEEALARFDLELTQ